MVIASCRVMRRSYPNPHFWPIAIGLERMRKRSPDPGWRSGIGPGGVGPEPIAVVDVLAEPHDAVGGRPCRDIDPMQRHRRREADIPSLPASEHLIDMRR